MELTVKQGRHGQGTFAAEPIRSGQRILRFTGPLLRYKDTSNDTLALQIGPDLYIGASGGPDDFVNHSCDPNAGIRIDGTTAELFAIRDIAAGEEIFFDYSTIIDEDDFTMSCLCGTPGCRRTIADGKYLPEKVWQRYESLGILPEYVRRSRGQVRRV
jgi:hypothetical protein